MERMMRVAVACCLAVSSGGSTNCWMSRGDNNGGNTFTALKNVQAKLLIKSDGGYGPQPCLS